MKRSELQQHRRCDIFVEHDSIEDQSSVGAEYSAPTELVVLKEDEGYKYAAPTALTVGCGMFRLLTSAATACWLFASLLLTPATSQAQVITFGHLNAGALGTNQNDQLVWANGALFATNSGYVNMPMATSGVAAGFFSSSSPTLTALTSTTLPAGLPPAPGSFLQVQLTLVSAPAGGSFGFWLSGALSPSYSLNVGDSTPLIDLSDPATAGHPGDDPFGHLHGRRFTATELGDYIIGLQIFDVSTNGSGGGPIHTPSDMFLVDFKAVPEPGSLGLVALGVAGILFVRFRRAKQR